MKAPRIVALSIALVACGSDKDQTPSTPKTTAPAKSSVATTASAKPSASAPLAIVAPPQPAIRENASIGPVKDDASFELRMFVSKLTTKDPIHLAFRWRPTETIGKGHPWLEEQVKWSEALDDLRFEVKQEGGASQVYQIGQNRKVESASSLSDVTREVTLTSAGLIESGGEPLPWKTPKDLFSKPGKYTVSVSGTMKTSKRSLTVVSKPLSFEVVEASDTQKTLAELEVSAVDLVTRELSLKSKPRPTASIIDDVEGNRWFRYELAYDGDGGYDADVIEVSLDAAGKKVAIDRYKHFTCVAEETLIATPHGDVPVESLVLGQEVVSYDERLGQRSVSKVLQIERAHADELLSLSWASGTLLVTRSHPVLVDGTWTLAGDIAKDATLLTSAFGVAAVTVAPIEHPTTVYDLSVSPPNTYFAGGVLLHNKAVHVPIGGSQPFRGWFFRRAAK